MENADTTGLGYLPHIVLGGYLLLLLVIGVVGYRRSVGGEEDYYLARRGQGWIVSALTIMATFFSSFALLGAPGMVYRDGVVFALFSLNVPLAGLAVYLFGSKIHRLGRAKGYVTQGDMICDYYQSPFGLRILAALIGFLYAVPYVVMQIQAGGLLSEKLFPGENSFEIGAIILALITMIYIMIGGMRSVAWTDVIQGILLVGGMLLAGWAAVAALGGTKPFFAELSKLPKEALSVPGTTGNWGAEKLFTVCLFASLGSMIQPAQWMRYYAAKSVRTLGRSALIFATVLTFCYFFGIMLVGLGGQVLYPLAVEGGAVAAHSDVGAFDQIVVVVLKNHLPELMGPIGAALAALIMVAIMAAAMSTADSNLHALSAVLTRDIFDRYVKPESCEQTKLWVGRGVIALATILALILVIVSRHSEHFNPIAMIAQLGLLAIAFSSQLLPVTVDMCFVRRGSRAGAIAGIVISVIIVALFSPIGSIILGAESETVGLMSRLGQIIDIGAWGLVGNVGAFVLVSLITQRPERDAMASLSAAMDGAAEKLD